MKVSKQWLAKLVNLDGLGVDELGDVLTFAGVEVEGVEQTGVTNDAIVAAKIESTEKHPNADRLSVCQVDDGTGELRQIVCGAKNFSVGDVVPLAQPGAVLGEDFIIKIGKLRGVESQGMLCSPSELGLPGDDSGLMILPSEVTPGTKMAALFSGDVVYELEVTPNRPDLLSHLGIAREIAALTGRELSESRFFSGKNDEIKFEAGEFDRVNVEDVAGCAFYSLAQINGVQVGASRDWLSESLRSVGLRPINSVVDITNFVMMETGQPLHAFDAAKVIGDVVVRRAVTGEKFVALDGQEYELSAEDLVIADSEKVLALAGIIGGADSGVDETTTDILLESAYFDMGGVRQTARRLGIITDSSYRFERGVVPVHVLPASQLAAELILENCGGKINGSQTVGELPAAAANILLKNTEIFRMFRGDISREKCADIFSRLGLEEVARNDNESEWKIPAYRLDLQRSIDLLEEIARVYGLDKITPEPKAVANSTTKSDQMWDAIATIRMRLVSRSFCEVKNINFVSREELENFSGIDSEEKFPPQLTNPLNSEHEFMRPNLLAGLLKTASHNIRHGCFDLCLFEIGAVFANLRKKNRQTFLESNSLGMLLTGQMNADNWQDEARDYNFHDLVGIIESLLPGGFSCRAVKKKQAAAPHALEASCEIFHIKKPKATTKIGSICQILPTLAKRMDIRKNVFVAEIDLKKLIAATKQEDQFFAPLPKFPAITRDTTIELSATTPVADLIDRLKNTNLEYIEDIKLKNVFSDPSGKKLATDKKNITITITYRSPEKTLLADDVDKIHDQAVGVLNSSAA